MKQTSMRPLFAIVVAAGGILAAGAMVPARAQNPQAGFSTTAPARPGVTESTPAPVPSVPPPMPDTGAPSFVPEKVAGPDGRAEGIGSRTGATPFSAGPQGTTLPDGQPPSAHDKSADGIAGPTTGGR